MKQQKYTVFSAGLQTCQITEPVQFCIIASAIPTVVFLNFLQACRGMLWVGRQIKSSNLIVVIHDQKNVLLQCCCYW